MNCSILETGAVGDGRTLNTQSIQKAVDRVAASGGGRVVIPAGRFLSGTIVLKSMTTLYLEKGAVLLGSTDLSDYTPNGYNHPEFNDVLSLVTCLGGEQIAIDGEGVIDFQGSAFMRFDDISPCAVPIEKYSPEQIEQTVVRYNPRPNQMIFFHDCRHVALTGVTLRDAACWTVSLSRCSEIAIHHVTIDNHLRIPNDDGIHLSSCRNAMISDCNISCGDDCVAITGITDYGVPSRNILVSHCLMRSRSAGVRLGHLASRVEDMRISELLMYDVTRGICCFAGTDGYVRGIDISGVTIKSYLYAGNWWGNGDAMTMCACEPGSLIEDVRIGRVRAESDNGIAIMDNGNGSIRGVSLYDWNIDLRRSVNHELIDKGVDLQPHGTRPVPEGHQPWLCTNFDVSRLNLSNMTFRRSADSLPSDADMSRLLLSGR